MRIRLGNTYGKLIEATEAERAWISDLLCWQDPKAFYWARARGRRPKPGEGTVRLFNLWDSTFPTGFLRTVMQGAKAAGHAVEIEDGRTRPSFTPGPVAEWLRDYQREATDSAQRKTRGLLHIPTGGGKTEIAAALFQEIPVRWLFVVHRTTLAEQAAERVERRIGQRPVLWADGDDPRCETCGGYGMAGEGPDDAYTCPDCDGTGWGGRIICGTFQSVVAARKAGTPWADRIIRGAHGIIVDEAHTLPADTFYRTVMSCTNAYWRIGLSGTPLARGDRRSILTIGALGAVIYKLDPSRLIDEGVLAKPDIRAMRIRQNCDRPTYQGVYSALVVNSSKRNNALAEMAVLADKPALLFVQQLKHGRELRKRLEKAGLQVDFIWGSHATEQRQRAIKRLVTGKLDVLICSVVFQEGVDIPELRSVIIGSGGRSVIAALQRIGRGMRVTKEKNTFQVFDIADEGHTWTERAAKERLAAYREQSYKVHLFEEKVTVGAGQTALTA